MYVGAPIYLKFDESIGKVTAVRCDGIEGAVAELEFG